MSGVLPEVFIAGLSQEKLVNEVPEVNVLFYHYADVSADGDEISVEVVAAFVEGFQPFLEGFQPFLRGVQPFLKGFERGFGRGVG